MPLPGVKKKSNKLDSSKIATFRQLEFFARRVVEGFITGLHKSPFKGFAIEFEEHRPYAPGDDLKHVDWKLLAKSGRVYIKQYEEDTSLRCFLLVDRSGSMGYSSTGHSKYDTARFVAGVLAYMLIGQKDAVGLSTFTSKVETHLPARSTSRHLKQILDTLDETEVGDDTGLGEVMHNLALRIRRRALVVILSDFFDDPAEIIRALNHFAHKKHEVVVIQVLDKNEVEFPFRDLTRFESLEGESFKLVEPLRLKREYQKQFHAHQRELREACHRLRIDFVEFRTHDPEESPIETALARYLTQRLRR